MKKAFCAILLFLLLRSTIIYSQTPTLQFTLYGEKAGDLFGIAAPAGDVNGDGYPDFFVTAPGGNYAKLYFGGPAFNPAHFIKFSKPKTIHFAKIAAGIGDINGDGYDDFAIGSSDYYGNIYGWMPGKVWIYHGGTAIDTNAVYEIEGKYYRDTFGSLIKPAGDVNKDGYADFIISAPYNWTNGKGYVVLVLGGKSIESSSMKTFTNNEVSSRFGITMEGPGDINNDGYDDFIIGSPGGFTAGNFSGKAYVYYGSSSIATTPAYIIDEVNEPYFGCSIVKAGDINGDENKDFFISSAASFRLYTSENNFIKIKNPCGPTICAGQDLNNDGKDDFIFGQGSEYNSDGIMTGKIDIMLGASVVDTLPKFTLYGKYQYEGFGGEIQSIGDINKDGYPEFVLAMPYNYPMKTDPQNYNPIGKAEIYSFNNVVVGIEKKDDKLPDAYTLKQNYPNPFNPTTIINYSVANTEHVTVKVFNILSQEVATLVNETKAAGTYQARFNAGNLPSGIYIARIQSGGYTKSIKMQLVK